jgi:hypothetical protein
VQNLMVGMLAVLIFVASTGCQSIGNNASYMIKYKKDLRRFYEEIINEPQAKKDGEGDDVYKARVKARKESRANEARTYLPSIYLTNLPLSLTDHYDTREPEAGRKARAVSPGDPVNIIINKVHLADNAELICGESLCLDTAEIAVVVTVDDGKQDEPKNVLVAYEEGLKRNVDLPIANLLTYSTSSYDNQPIRITLTVFEFDQLENENFKKIITTAAGIGATLTPAYAPLWSMATQVGNFLINQNRDDVIATFTFQVYPRRTPPLPNVIGDLGKPPIQEATYIVINSTEAPVDVNKSIHLDFAFNAFTINNASSITSDSIVGDDYKLKTWPLEKEPIDGRQPLKQSYVTLTVSKAPTQSAALIIDRLDALNRKATGLTKLESRSQAGAALLGRDLDDVRSAVTWFFAEGEYAQRKTDSRALGEIFRLVKDPRLNESDVKRANELIDRSLPPMSEGFKQANGITTKEQEMDLENRRKWYDLVKVNAAYDVIAGRLMCKDAEDKEKTCQ